METIFVYLFVIILFSIISSSKTEKQFNTLDNESKLKLFEVNISIRKINYISLLVIIAFYYAMIKLDLFDIYIPFIITFLLLMITTTIIAYKKCVSVGITTDYLKKAMVIRLTLLLLTCVLLAFYYYTTDNSKETGQDFRYEAQDYLKENNYADALKCYTNAIELDSTDGNSFYNRGICKYYLKDFNGACKDWGKANELGQEEAMTNINSFCK